MDEVEQRREAVRRRRAGETTQQVAAALAREALRDPSQPEPWQALFELGTKGGAEAAEALIRVISQADPDRINLRIAVGLGAVEPPGTTPSMQSLVKAKETAMTKKGKFGTAVTRASKK